jgi:NTE family protein
LQAVAVDVRAEVRMTSRALVLGGGGPVGIGWEAGLLAGLAEGGVHVSNADLIVGTSAGSVVGGMLACGASPREIYERQLEPPDRDPRPIGHVDLTGLIGHMMKLYTSERPQQELIAEIGDFALSAQTMTERDWISGFESESLTSGQWPERFVCTAIDTADGFFRAWDAGSGVRLSLAVASSCAVPGVFPPVTIDGRRYMDGGIGSTTNAQLARGHDRIIVVYVTAGTAAANSPIADVRRERFEREIGALRDAGSEVGVIVPNDEFNEKIGFQYMAPEKRQEAAEMGYRQGAEEATRLRPVWS